MIELSQAKFLAPIFRVVIPLPFVKYTVSLNGPDFFRSVSL